MAKNQEIMDLIRKNGITADDLMKWAEEMKEKENEKEPNRSISLIDPELLELFQQCKSNKGSVLSCPKCGSIAVVKNGKRNGRQRYLCKDCHCTHGDTYGTIFKYSKLSIDQWKTFISMTMLRQSLKTISKDMGINIATAWYARHKLASLFRQIDPEQDSFEYLVQADEYYTPLSFKGERDPRFFIEVLGRLPHTNMNKQQRIDYVEKAGYEVEQVEDLEKEQKRVFCKAKKEAFELNGLSSEEKRKRGISNNQVCIMTCVDKYGNTFFEPTCVGRLTPKYVKQLLAGKLGEDSIMITDSHVAYRKFAKEEHISLRQIPSGKHSIGTDNLSYVNSFHSRFADNEQRWSQVNSKYLDHYTALFRWLDKHRAESTQSKVATILKLMTKGFEPLDSRTLKYKSHPFDTKRVIPA